MTVFKKTLAQLVRSRPKTLEIVRVWGSKKIVGPAGLLMLLGVAGEQAAQGWTLMVSLPPQHLLTDLQLSLPLQVVASNMCVCVWESERLQSQRSLCLQDDDDGDDDFPKLFEVFLKKSFVVMVKKSYPLDIF